MFDDKKKLFKLVAFLVIVLILSLNSLSAADYGENSIYGSGVPKVDMGGSKPVTNDINEVLETDPIEDSYYDGNVAKSPPSIAEETSSKKNLTISVIILNDKVAYAEYVEYMFVVSNAGSATVESIHFSGLTTSSSNNVGSNNILVNLDKNNGLKYDNILLPFYSENSYLNQHIDANFLILLNLINIQYNGNTRLTNDIPTFFNSDNNYIIIFDEKENKTISILINNNFTESCTTNDNSNPIQIDLNYGVDKPVNRNINQNNQIVDFEKHSTSDIFQIPKLDISNELLFDNEYFTIIKIHSSSLKYVLPVVVIQSNVKYQGYHNIYFFDIWGNPLVNSLITFEIDGIFYSKITDNESKIALLIDLVGEDYTLNNINCDGNSTINYSIFRNTDEGLVENYNIGKECFVKVLDNDQIPVMNTLVTFELNGIFYSSTTNNKGIATLGIDLDYGKHILTIIHPIYNLKIDKFIEIEPVLKGEDMVVNHKDKALYKVQLSDDLGRPIAGEVISMRLGNVHYEIFTDINGIASLEINLTPGYYTITSTFQECSIFNNVIVK